MEKSKKILIIGAGKAGYLLAKDIKTHHPEHQVIGFVDDKIKAVKGLFKGKLADIEKLVHTYEVDEMVVAIPSADGALMRKILLENKHNNIPLFAVPRSQRIIAKSDVRYANIKEIGIEDFLGRPFIDKNIESLKRFYKGKIIFISGGAGSIGSEIVHQLLDLEVKKVIVYDNSEYLTFLLEQELKERGTRSRCELVVGNILNENKLNRLFKRVKPDIVFHAAAYKHVHLMQDNIDEAIYNNVFGTKTIIDAALKNNIKTFTFISTDKVVNPTSVMGATKKLCEYYIQSLRSQKMKFNIVRFGNVINSNGSALPFFERQIALYRRVTITHKKMQRFFMSIREASSLVIESTAKGRSNNIYILNMGELINIYDIVLSLIRSKNLIPNKDVEIQVTGLRKGEKMIEELYTEEEKEQMKSTRNKKVYQLKNSDSERGKIEEILSDLEKQVGTSSNRKLFHYLKSIFPSIKS